VVAEGDSSRSFYLLGDGVAQVRKRIGGGERTLATLGPGDLFGIMSFVDGRPRSASVVMVEPGHCIAVEPETLERAAGLNFTVSFKFLGALCGVMARTFRDTCQQVVGAIA